MKHNNTLPRYFYGISEYTSSGKVSNTLALSFDKAAVAAKKNKQFLCTTTLQDRDMREQ